MNDSLKYAIKYPLCTAQKGEKLYSYNSSFTQKTQVLSHLSQIKMSKNVPMKFDTFSLLQQGAHHRTIEKEFRM
jgi:uncharacterized protein YpmS